MRGSGPAVTVALAATLVLATGCSLLGGEPSVEPGASATAGRQSAEPARPSPPDGDGDGDPAGASAVDVRAVEHAGNRYGVVTLPLDAWDVRVEWDPEDGGVMLADVIEADPTIAVATNAGIFTPEMVPGGLLVSDGEELVPLNLSDGAGNFHLMPNAVFAVLDDGTATVVDSVDYEPAGVAQATQSGPALVLDGEVHPAFTEGSDNLAVRSGVGVSPDGATVYLAISAGLTNLWDFATLFRDELGVDDALYLDGQISDLWVEGFAEPGVLAGPYAGVITARER